MTDLPVEVYGINLLVRLVPDTEAAIRLRCPKGGTILYGQVVARGDGFDPDGNVLRPLPHLDALVVFEEGGEEDVRGHGFEVAGEEYRLITIDDVLLSFPPAWRKAERQ